MNIYVGNLSRSVTEEALRTHFEAFGQVNAVRIIKDHITGNARGFAFVDMPNDEEAQASIDALNGRAIEGRNVVVNEARPRPARPAGGPRGGGNGPRGGGSGGGFRSGGFRDGGYRGTRQ